MINNTRRLLLLALALAAAAMCLTAVRAASDASATVAAIEPELTTQLGAAEAGHDAEKIHAFAAFAQHHHRVYSAGELVKRFKLYKAHDEWIQKFNSENHSFKVGHNIVSDLTPEEKRALHSRTPLHRNNHSSVSAAAHLQSCARLSSVPDFVDWRPAATNGAQNQGGCGSCWIFGSAAAMEGGYYVDKGVLLKFSEQYMLDCATVGAGCQGGFPTDLAGWLQSNGAPQAQSYTAYHESKSSCGGASPIYPLSSYYSVPPGSESNGVLRMYVADRVVAQELCVDDAWSSYSSGIYSNIANLDRSKCGYHEIAVVGYGYDVPSGWNFWIVRNSWGPGYGVNGYIYMRAGNNECEMNEMNAVAFYYSPVGYTTCPVVNEGSTASINCGAGRVISSINFASYGTPTGGCGSFATGSCHASNSHTTVENAMLFRQSASVDATNAVFGDPCSGTPKRLAIQATCSPFKCATVSENSNGVIQCAKGSVIARILFASYGTPSGSCGSFSVGSCHASNSQAVVSAACVGQNSCSVPATNAVFGDPCLNTPKQLAITAVCVY